MGFEDRTVAPETPLDETCYVCMPLHHPMVPFKAIKVHSKKKDTRPQNPGTSDVLWHSEVLGSLTHLSKESTAGKKLSPQTMFQVPTYTSDDDDTRLPFLRIAPYISKQITEKITVQFLFHPSGRGKKIPMTHRDAD